MRITIGAFLPLDFYAPYGQSCYRTVELLDLFPTLAGLCGLTPPANLEGKSLRPLLDSPKSEWQRPPFTQTARRVTDAGGIVGRSVRTERFRYTEWDGGSRELYDQVNDPKEYHNLAKDPAYASKVAEIKSLLPNQEGQTKQALR